MLKRRRSEIAVGLLLLLTGLLGLRLLEDRETVLSTQPHVVVDISNVEGTVQVSVDCEQALSVDTGEARKLDLGRMPPGRQIFISTISRDRHPAWDIRIHSNGSIVFEDERGHPKAPLAPRTQADAVVFAEAFTAGGDRLGHIGCQEPGVVSKGDVPGYTQSPDDGKVPEAEVEESSFQPRHFPYDQIDALGRRSLPALAVLGAVAAIGTPAIRRLAWAHKGVLVTGALAVLGAGLQVTDIPTILTFAGTALLFAVASFLVVGEARTRRWYRQL